MVYLIATIHKAIVISWIRTIHNPHGTNNISGIGKYKCTHFFIH